MAKQRKRPSAFVPRLVLGTIAAGVLPVLGAAACHDDDAVALAVVAFDAAGDSHDPGPVALAISSFDASADAAAIADGGDAGDGAPEDAAGPK